MYLGCRQGSGSSPSSSQRGSGESLRRSGDDDVAARFQAAIAAKDDVAQRLGQELAAAREQVLHFPFTFSRITSTKKQQPWCAGLLVGQLQ